MLSRTPWSSRRYNERSRTFKLRQERRRYLILVLAKAMREAEPTPFAAEAPGRHRIRISLVLQGWPWLVADHTAAAIIREALKRVGARRPYWIEGQREYTTGAFLRDDNCWRCGEPLPPHAKKFCPICARITHEERKRLRGPAAEYRRQDQSTWCRMIAYRDR